MPGNDLIIILSWFISLLTNYSTCLVHITWQKNMDMCNQHEQPTQGQINPPFFIPKRFIQFHLKGQKM